ncbi:MAG: DUF3106 domain-containing protein [Rubrivivax sp.]
MNPVGLRGRGAVLAVALWVCVALWFAAPAAANGSSGAAASPGKTVWSSLSKAEKQALQPLQKDWHTLTADRQKKWLEVAARMPIMSDEERGRVRERMAEWARMTPAQRAQARLQFQEFRHWPSEDRQALWEAYLALSDTERAQFAGQAQRSGAQDPQGMTEQAGAGKSEPKSNLISSTLQGAVIKKSVAPTVVQIKPGATTQLISRTGSPPPHHQPGLPKIAATANFVDPLTLLPKRGPQAAAMAVSSGEAPVHP